MTPVQRRLFIALDEWLGIVVLLWMHRTHDGLFWPALVFWAVSVYAISYPWHWWKQHKEETNDASRSTQKPT